MRKVISLGLAAVLVLTVSGTTLAKGGNGGGPGSTGGTSTITLVTPASLAPVAFGYGDTVGTFSTYPASITVAYARLRCTANASTVPAQSAGVQVYDVMQAVQDGTWSSGGYASFNTAASPTWTGGGADCTASLMTFTWRKYQRIWSVLASVAFTVAG